MIIALLKTMFRLIRFKKHYLLQSRKDRKVFSFFLGVLASLREILIARDSEQTSSTRDIRSRTCLSMSFTVKNAT